MTTEISALEQRLHEASDRRLAEGLARLVREFNEGFAQLAPGSVSRRDGRMPANMLSPLWTDLHCMLQSVLFHADPIGAGGGYRMDERFYAQAEQAWNELRDGARIAHVNAFVVLVERFDLSTTQQGAVTDGNQR